MEKEGAAKMNRLPCLLALVAAGCVGPLQMVAESVPLNGRPYRVLGAAEGEACRSRFLFIPLGWKAGISEAYDDALGRYSEADGMIEITIDETWLELFFYAQTCTRIRGRAIKIEK
jgi:hypothetical protein